MTDSPRIIAVVPVHNGREATLAFLASMAGVTWKHLQIILVDDGSDDGTAAAVASRFPEVLILQGTGSLWWAGATNLGIGAALARGADYLLLINNDNLVAPGFIEPLLQVLTEYPRSLVTSKMLDVQERSFVCSFGGKIDWHLGEIRDYNSRRDRLDFDRRRECDWLHGGSTLVSAAAIAELGLIDAERYPQYLADAEFSLRAKRRGYRLFVEPASVVYHRTAISAGTESLNRENVSALLRGIRSPFNFRANAALYAAYAPRHLSLLFLAIRYARLGYSLVRRRYIDRVRRPPAC